MNLSIIISLFLTLILIITLFRIPKKEHFGDSCDPSHCSGDSIHSITNPSLPSIWF